MKKYIRCSNAEYLSYPIEIHAAVEFDQTSFETQLRQILIPAAEYISQVEVNIGILSTNDIRVKSNLGVAQLRVARPTKDIRLCIDGLLRQLKDALPKFIHANEQKAAARQSKKSLISAQALVIKLVRKEFDISPTFHYSDSGKIQYHLWMLPFTDNDTSRLDVQAAKEFYADLDSFLTGVKQKYDIHMEWFLPLGGSRIYAAMEILVWPDINRQRYTYNKRTGDYDIVE